MIPTPTSSMFKVRASENFEPGTLNFEHPVRQGLLGEGREVFITELRKGIVRRALSHS